MLAKPAASAPPMQQIVTSDADARLAAGDAGDASVPLCLCGPSSLAGKFKVFAGDIKIAHTVFALPFALLSTFLAAATTGLPHRLPYPGQLALILACMFTARTIAMAMNRLLDAAMDGRSFGVPQDDNSSRTRYSIEPP